MAKKRGRKKKEEIANKHELPGGFWRQIMAFLMIVLAILLIVSWLGSGGIALQKTDEFLMKIFGYTKYLFPFILVYLSVLIFRAPDNRVDPSVWVASVLIIFWFCGIFGVPSYGKAVQTGGMIGESMNSVMVKNLDQPVSILIYVVLIIITALFMYAETPAALFRKIGSMFKTKETEDAENANVIRRTKAAANDDGMRNFKVNSNVEIVDNSKKEKKGLLVKNSDKVEKVVEEPTALISVSDPNWKMPPMDLLNKKHSPADPGDTHSNAATIKDTLEQFGIDVEVEGANVGPRITQYTLRPPAGVKVSKIAQLDRELSLSLAKEKIRIEAPIPGTRAVGIEIPNNKAASVGLHELLKSSEWSKMIIEKPLAFTVGKDISGHVILGNLAKMPHLLIAGTTGSGKSVMTNTLIMSMLYHNSPADLKLIIIDPKQVEMAAYDGIPHLLSPIITDVTEALSSMEWAVKEMERRYTEMKNARVKNIIDYNAKMSQSGETVTITDENDNEQKHDNGKMPYIVIIVDEMADLMMMAGKELENRIVRIAQKGRAAGIHLVLATQRPEVKVVTGLIKANIPGRIAFAVNNNTDSRVMLDMGGAEKLLGSGDMLFLTTEMMGKPVRVQGAFVSDAEIGAVTDYLRQQAPADYNPEVTSQSVAIGGKGSSIGMDFGPSGGDTTRQAAEIALREGKISTSLLQRRLHVGYGRAAAIIDELVEKGVVSSESGGGNRGRDVLISSMDEYPD
ncbi:DNA translocase FtsK 4TM domain-containing protein [Candidatus Saccharibacteria bacterium]|nr:DNA translocase FtsK 4TM domain-containing protein [Candidatus Saccharibacteria bacterium]